MTQNQNRKTFSYYFFTQQHCIFIAAVVLALVAGTYLFMKSHAGRQLWQGTPLARQEVPAHVIRKSPDAHWIKPVKVSTQHASMKDNFQANAQERQRLVDWISKRYGVKAQSTELYVSAAYLAAHEMSLDPHLILAVMAIESSFNPNAVSPVGAQGLMQVMTKVHRKRFEPHGGVHKAKDPVTNIRVGSAILKEYVTRGGSVERGLKRYVGAAAYSHDFGYGQKVLAEQQRIKQVARGSKVSTTMAARSAPKKLARAQSEKDRVSMTLPAKSQGS